MCERNIGLRSLFLYAGNKYTNSKIKQMRFNTQDRGYNSQKIYSMCYDSRNPQLKKSCGPDCFFHHWPSASISSFDIVKDKIIEASSCKPEIEKIGWYGNIHSPLKDVPEFKTRPLLKQIGDLNPDLFEIVHVPANKINPKNSDYLSLPNLVKKYKFLIDIGGNGWSGRRKFLHFSKRPLLLVERRYIEYFHDDMQPYIHYIPVKEDLSDLLEKANWLFKNDDKGKEIANNAYNFAIENFSKEKLAERIKQVYDNINNSK